MPNVLGCIICLNLLDQELLNLRQFEMKFCHSRNKSYKINKKYYSMYWVMRNERYSLKSKLEIFKTLDPQPWNLIHSLPMHPFCTPWKRVEKGCIGKELVNTSRFKKSSLNECLILLPKHIFHINRLTFSLIVFVWNEMPKGYELFCTILPFSFLK